MTKVITPGKSEIREFNLAALTVDPEVQRTHLDEKRARAIAEKFNWDAFGYPAVSERDNGEVVILDGMHRVKGALLRAYADNPDATPSVRAECEVWKGLTKVQEAAIFLDRNKTAVVAKVDQFLVRIIAGDEVAVAIADMLDKYGWRVSPTGGEATVQAVVTLEKYWVANPWVAEKAVEVATSAWAHDRYALDNRVLGGLCVFFQRYEGAVDIRDLVARLTTNLRPGDLIGTASVYHKTMHMPMARAAAEIIIETYNKRRQTSKLPVFSG